MTQPEPGSRLIKNSVLTIVNTLLSFATGWIISIWVARQLGPANYGVFSLVLWLSGTISWALGLGLIHAVTKFIAEFKGKNDHETVVAIVRFVFGIELVITVIATVILIFFELPISRYFFTPHESFYFFLVFLGLAPGMATAVFSAAIEGLQKFEYFLYANLIITPFSFVAKVVVLLTGRGISGLLIVMLIFSFVNALFYAYVLRREGVIRFGGAAALAREVRTRIRRYNASVIAILVCDKIVWDKSETFFLGRLCRSTEVAYYNLGFNIAQKFVSILPLTFWRVLFPTMSHYFGSGDHNKMSRIFFLATRYLAFFAFPVGVGGMILAYPLILYFYGHDYVIAQRTLQIIFVASIFSSLSNPASAVLYGYERQAFIYRYGAFLAVVNIALDIWLIRPYGAVGAAVAYGITTILGSVGGLVYTCRLMKLSYPIVSLFKILFSTIIMGIVMELIAYRFHEWWGFATSAISGAVVYLTCSMVLGTFEKEDYALLESVKKALPGPARNLMGAFITLIAAFKTDR